LFYRYEGKNTPIPGKRRKRPSKAPAQPTYKGPTTLAEWSVSQFIFITKLRCEVYEYISC